MNFTVAKSWSELNAWQLGEIAKISLNTSSETYQHDYLKMIEVLFRNKKTWKTWVKWYYLISVVPISEIKEYADFLLETPQLDKFPELKFKNIKLHKPGDRLNNIPIKQFSVIDAIFYNWIKTKEEIYLRQLVASLYTIDGVFNKLMLPQVAEYTDKLSKNTMYQIGITYLSIRHQIIERYKKIFPEVNENEDNLKPTFKKENSYIPFRKIIEAMAFDERQPLGTYQQCKETNMYEFFNLFQESIIRHEKLEKEYAKLK